MQADRRTSVEFQANFIRGESDILLDGMSRNWKPSGCVEPNLRYARAIRVRLPRPEKLTLAFSKLRPADRHGERREVASSPRRSDFSSSIHSWACTYKVSKKLKIPYEIAESFVRDSRQIAVLIRLLEYFSFKVTFILSDTLINYLYNLKRLAN